MASPIQILLNPENFEEARDAGGGGPKKDFFAERDSEFRAHKRALLSQIEAVSTSLANQSQGDIGFIKVILRREAWAKSHRPIRSLLRPDRISLVGGGDLGEMYFEARPRQLRAVGQDISGAEETTRLKPDPNSGRMVPHPSTAKSESGAIERIELYGPGDRRKFSVEDALGWLANPMTGSSYQIELFEVPPPRSQWDAVGPDRQRLYSSFMDGLAAIGQGLTVQRLQTGEKEPPQLSLRLGRSAEPPTVRLSISPSGDRRRTRDLAPFDPSVDRHRRLLSFLDHHPLVRRIELPPILTRTIVGERSSAQSSVGAPRVRPEQLNLPDKSTTRAYPRLGVIDGGLGVA